MYDPFETLGIPITSTEKDIKKAFRSLSVTYHPDKNINDPDASFKY